jgi:hypothetical protein
MKGTRIAAILLGAVLLAACAPTTTSGLEAPKPQVQLPTLGELAEAYMRPFREMDIAALFSEENRGCYAADWLVQTSSLSGEGNRIKLEKVLADPEKSKAYFEAVKRVLLRERVALDKLEVRLRDPKVLPDPGRTYKIEIYLESAGIPRVYTLPVVYDPYKRRVCRSRKLEDRDFRDFYWGIGYHFSQALYGIE